MANITLTTDQELLSHIIEDTLLSRLENVNPVPSNPDESESLNVFLSLAQRYATLIEPSEQFTRQIIAFINTMNNQRYRAQRRNHEQHVQITRLGAKRVFGTDITREVDQNTNISNNTNNRF